MRTHIVRLVVAALVVGLICPSVAVTAQTQDAAAYWQAYAAAMPLNATIKVGVSDGSRMKGRIAGIVGDDLVIRRHRAFRRAIEQRVPFAEIVDLEQTHPTRDAVITGVAGFGGLYLVTLVWMNHALKGH